MKRGEISLKRPSAMATSGRSQKVYVKYTYHYIDALNCVSFYHGRTSIASDTTLYKKLHKKFFESLKTA